MSQISRAFRKRRDAYVEKQIGVVDCSKEVADAGVADAEAVAGVAEAVAYADADAKTGLRVLYTFDIIIPVISANLDKISSTFSFVNAGTEAISCQLFSAAFTASIRDPPSTVFALINPRGSKSIAILFAPQ